MSGQRHHHLAVEAAGTQQRRVQHVGAVGGGDQDDALAGFEAVHLDQQLVQRLFALVIATTQAGATLAANGIDLVDEDDAGSVLLGIFEHVAHTRGTHADEHLDEVRTGDGEERHLGLAGDGTGQQGFTGTRGADHQHATGNAAAQLLEAGGIAQEFDHLLHFFLGFIGTGHVGKGDGVVVLVQHAGPALAEGEGATTPPRPASGA